MLVCHCFRITRARMRAVIEDHGCASVEDVSALTGACRGCMTCRPDIEAILAAVAKERREDDAG